MCFSIYAFLKINVVIGYVLKIDEAYRGYILNANQELNLKNKKGT